MGVNESIKLKKCNSVVRDMQRSEASKCRGGVWSLQPFAPSRPHPAEREKLAKSGKISQRQCPSRCCRSRAGQDKPAKSSIQAGLYNPSRQRGKNNFLPFLCVFACAFVFTLLFQWHNYLYARHLSSIINKMVHKWNENGEQLTVNKYAGNKSEGKRTV